MSEAARLMDRIYGPQRHIYDATRKFYLLGRDRMIRSLDPPANGQILEIGCGTARNLIRIAKTYPDTTCHGLDVSEKMLETAARSIARAGLSDRIRLARADASDFDASALFARATFDRVVISYALSMIPPWRAVLAQGAEVVAPGGALRIVDFGDQAEMPALFAAILHRWLARFHVAPRADLADAVRAVAERKGFVADVTALYRGYAVAAELRRPCASLVEPIRHTDGAPVPA